MITESGIPNIASNEVGISDVVLLSECAIKSVASYKQKEREIRGHGKLADVILK